MKKIVENHEKLGENLMQAYGDKKAQKIDRKSRKSFAKWVKIDLKDVK